MSIEPFKIQLHWWNLSKDPCAFPLLLLITWSTNMCVHWLLQVRIGVASRVWYMQLMSQPLWYFAYRPWHGSLCKIGGTMIPCSWTISYSSLFDYLLCELPVNLFSSFLTKQFPWVFVFRTKISCTSMTILVRILYILLQSWNPHPFLLNANLSPWYSL